MAWAPLAASRALSLAITCSDAALFSLDTLKAMQQSVQCSGKQLGAVNLLSLAVVVLLNVNFSDP